MLGEQGQLGGGTGQLVFSGFPGCVPSFVGIVVTGAVSVAVAVA